jgi:hypothetical protein
VKLVWSFFNKTKPPSGWLVYLIEFKDKSIRNEVKRAMGSFLKEGEQKI